MEDDSDDASSVASLGFEVELPSDGEEDSIAPADGSLELEWEASAPPDDGESDDGGDGSQEFPAAPDDTSQEFPAAPADTSQDDEAEESERLEHTQTVAIQEEPSQARVEPAARPDAAAERASGEPDGEADARAEPGPPEEHPEDQAERQEQESPVQDTEPMPEQEPEQEEPQAAGLDVAQQAEVVQGPAVVIGNSLGGLTALTAAVLAPDKVQAVVAAPLPDPALIQPLPKRRAPWRRG